MASETEEPLELAPVESDDDDVADEYDRDRHPAGPGHHFNPRRLVLSDVLRLERHAVSRKELFRRVTGRSRGGPVDGHLSIGHRRSFREALIA